MKGPTIAAASIPATQVPPLRFTYTFVPFAEYRTDFRGVEQLALQHGRPTGQLPIFVWLLVPMDADITNSTGFVEFDKEHWAVPWVVWDDAGPGMGVGVYAWRPFLRGDIIGVYTGNVLSEAQFAALPDDSRTGAITTIGGHRVDGKHPPRTDYDGLLNLMYDPARYPWPGMGAHLLNGVERERSSTINVRVTEPIGVLQATRDIKAVYDPRSVATAEGAERAARNRRSQMFWWYGESYGKPGDSTAVSSASHWALCPHSEGRSASRPHRGQPRPECAGFILSACVLVL